MTTEATILLVGGTPPLGELMAELEEAGLFVEVASPRDFPSAFEVVQPDLVVHVGAPSAQATVAFLHAEAQARRLVRVVLVGERAELSTLRRLDRHIVQSVLALDIPHRLIVERIRGLAQRMEGDGATGGRGQSAGLALDRMTPAPPPQSPEEKLRAWVQSSRPPVITEMDEADEHLAGRWEGTHEFAPYVDVTPASLDPEELVADEAESAPETAPLPSGEQDLESERETLVVDPSLVLVVSNDGETETPADEDARPTLPLDEDSRPTVALLPGDNTLEVGSSEQVRGVLPVASLGAVGPAAKLQAETGPQGATLSPGKRFGFLLAALGLAGAVGWYVRSGSGEPAARLSRSVAQLDEAATAVEAHGLGSRGNGAESEVSPTAEKPYARGPAPAGAPILPEAVPTLTPTVAPNGANALWAVAENPKIQRCDQLVPNRADLRLGDTDQSARYWKKARGSLLLGDVDSALVALCQASLVFPAGLVTEALIEHLLSLGAPRAAEPFMARARTDRPNRPRTIELAGDVACQMGNAEEARALWLRALGLEAPSASTLQQVAKQIAAQAALVRKGGQVGYAERLYRRAAILDSKNADAWRALAELEKERGHAAKALEFEAQIESK